MRASVSTKSGQIYTIHCYIMMVFFRLIRNYQTSERNVFFLRPAARETNLSRNKTKGKKTQRIYGNKEN